MSAVIKAGETLPAVQQEAGTLMQAIIQAAHDPKCDTDKMRQMMEMAKEMRAEQARAAYADALARFTAMKRTVATNRIGTAPGDARFAYADYPQMEATIRPWLAACDLSLTHEMDPPVMEGNRIAYVIVRAILSHREGYSTTISYPAMANPKVADRLSPSQAIQQGITYAKRQTAAMILGLSTAEDRHDDDGQKPAVLDDKQRSTLADLWAAWEPTDEDKARFYAWAKVETLDDISPKQYPGVVAALRKKAAAK